MGQPRGVYRIGLDGEWSLEDLYVLPRTFEQVYFLSYSLASNLDEFQVERIQHAYKTFPWQGGYSAVNFYNQLKYATKKGEMPRIVRIEYASPGALELGLIISVALNVKQLVKVVSETIKTANDTYTDVVRGMQKRKLMRIESKRAELQLNRDQIEYIEASAKRMSDAMGLNNLAEVHARTGSPYRSLKILLSLFRRVKTLVSYQKSGKADFLRPQRALQPEATEHKQMSKRQKNKPFE